MKQVIMMLSVCATWGCATAGGLKPIKRQNPFPDQAKLDAIEGKPTPSGVFEKSDSIRVAEWQLVGPLPDVIGPVARTSETKLDELMVELASKADNGIASEAMHCLARELGAFYLEYGGQPEKSLRRFMEHRCGITSPFVSTNWTFWDQGNVSWEDADKDGRTVKGAREALAALMPQLKNPELGAWYGSNDKRSVAMFAAASRLVDLQPMPMTVAPDGSFEVAGEFFGDGDDIVNGMVNHGEFDWARCHAMDVELPRFRVQCTADQNDIEAGFEIYTRRNGDLIGKSKIWQRVWPAGQPADKFVLWTTPVPSVPQPDASATAEAVEPDALVTPTTSPLAAPLEPVEFDTSPAAIRAEVLALINQRRAVGGLQPVELAEEQSEAATQLAPHYWGALKKDDSKTLHEIAFGLLAGRKVDGPIIDGSFYTGRVAGGPRDMVEELAARPGARNVIFGPEIDTLSIGATYEADAKVMGGMVHGWSFVPKESHLKRVNRFLDYISDARQVRGNAKPTKVVALNSLTNELAEKLSAGQVELHVAANQVVSAMAAKHPGERTMVYYFEAHDPSEIEIPSAILDTTPLDVAVVVAPYKPAELPWNVYGVVFAYVVRKSPTKVALARP